MVINIGASQTSVSIKKDAELIGISKIGIGINDLLSKISENTKQTRMEVLKNINTQEYQKEKDSFLSIWTQALLIGIKEIIGNEICPNTVAIF